MPKINLIVLRCYDVDGTRLFYEALGFEFIQEQHGDGPKHYVAYDKFATVFELYPTEDPTADETHNDRLGFEVENLDVTLERIRAVWSSGLGPVSKRTGRPYCLVRDPNGRKVELLGKKP